MRAPWPQQNFARHLEGRGQSLRSRLRLAPLSPLEPAALVATYRTMHLVDLHTLAGEGCPELEVLRRESHAWSAVAYRDGGGPWLITWNPWHSEARVRVSVMEEVCHIVLEHRPTALVPDPATGLPRRTYSPSKEKQAYGVAAAAVVPFDGLVQLLREGRDVDEIASLYGVSTALVSMRINVTRAREAVSASVGLASRG